MIKAGVIGYPVKHSLSPRIHNYWLKKYNIKGSYDAIEVHPDNLKGFLVSMIKNGFSGVNVTIPHKEKVLEILNNAADPFAKFIGAVNTIIIKDKNFICTNTDFIGFSRNVIEKEPEFDFSEGKAVVIGAGGAARAVIFALLSLNVPEIIIVNRTREKSEIIKTKAIKNFQVADKKILVAEWKNISEILKNASLLVNTTSLGMVGQNKLEIDLSNLPKTALVNDIVYNPLETKLLKTAKLRGNKVVDGLGMLLHQAAPGFEAWFGVRPEIDDNLRKFVLEGLVKK